MTRKPIVILSCDFCGAETASVETHSLTLDAKTTEAEACARCWAKLGKGIAEFQAKGRRVPIPRRKRGERAAATAGAST